MATSAASSRRSTPARAPRDVAQEITDEIVRRLEAGGELPWRQPWTNAAGGGLPLRHNGEKYRGINVFFLALKAMSAGYASPYWMSYRQAQELGGQVRRGETSTLVVYYGVAKGRSPEDDRKDDANPPHGESGEPPRRFLKCYPAFCADQIDGLPDRYHPERDEGERPRPTPVPELQAIAEAMTVGIGVGYREGGDCACYIRALDEIRMPELRRFEDHERQVVTLMHELGHACEHPKRLDLDYGAKSFGNEAYARAEIVVEMAAAILGATLGFRPDHLDDHAAYVQSWLKILRGEKRFILKAAADAQRVADHLLAAAETKTGAAAA